MDNTGVSHKIDAQVYLERLSRQTYYRETGRICKSVGLTFEGFLPGTSLGSVVRICSEGQNSIEAEVIGFRDKKAILMALDEPRGINTLSTIEIIHKEPTVSLSEDLIGRVLDARGNPIDQLQSDFKSSNKKRRMEQRGIYGAISNPLDRARIDRPLDLGIRAINGFLTCGMGQRLGIMAGSGVGKSTLLGMMARNTKADLNVIALIGERGREVREFIEKDLGPEGLRRSIVVAVTGEKSPLLRMRGAYVASTIAEYFCEKGANVLLMMDSVTRFCMAQREIGLSMGEPPASKGYTPSVFATLPKLLERAGSWTGMGSITALYTVLVDGDDLDEPISDAARAILDGHIVLSRTLAHRNHYPPIDIAQSVSRCMSAVADQGHLKNAGELRDLMAVYAANEDLINVGAYVKGNNPKLDQAIVIHDRISNFLKQKVGEKSNLQESKAAMQGILSAIG